MRLRIHHSALQVLTLAALTGLCISMLEPFWWVAQLFSHLRLLWLGLLVVASFLWQREVEANRRRWLTASLAGGCLALLLVSIPRLDTLPRRTGPPPAEALTLLSKRAAPGDAKALQKPRSKLLEADLLILYSVSGPQFLHMEALKESFPYHVTESRDDRFGIGLFSRLPLLESRVEDFSGYEVPSLIATVEWEGRPFELIATHPVPPIKPLSARVQHWHFEDLGAHVAEATLPVLLAGDFNTPLWSAPARRLRRAGRLRICAPAFLPGFSAHLATKDFRLVRSRVTRKGLRTELEWAPPD